MNVPKLLLVIVLLYGGQAYGQLKTNVYAGGVNGVTAMLNPRNSHSYRNMNGGLLIQNNAWGALEENQKRELLQAFEGKPTAMAIGFVRKNDPTDKRHPDTWYANAKAYYKPYGIKPDFVQCCCFKDGYVPTYQEWKEFHDKYTQIMQGSMLFPTFEYQNYNKSQQLLNNRISLNNKFQKIVSTSKGLVMDAPPRVFLERENAYREWVIDAFRYTKQQGYTSVLIISPDSSDQRFKQDTIDMLNILKQYDALPNAYVVENYIFDWWWQKSHHRAYPNKIGSESDANSIMGVAYFLKSKFAK